MPDLILIGEESEEAPSLTATLPNWISTVAFRPRYHDSSHNRPVWLD